MNILISSDNHYVSPVIILLNSLAINTKEQIDVYFMYSDVSSKNLKRIRSALNYYNARFYPIYISESYFSNAPTVAHFTRETYYRFLAAELLPSELDRVLYLDPDIIVAKDISELYHLSFVNNSKECFLIACEDRSLSNDKDLYDRLNLPEKYVYFNAGVLLMNLKLIRKELQMDVVYKFIKDNYSVLRYCDQDVLNALCFDKVRIVDWETYNLLICNLAKSKQYLIDEASIIHFAGPRKPWKYDGSKMGREHFKKYVKLAGINKWYYIQILKSYLRFVIKKKRLIKK